jgi:hypothetical protein
VAPVPYPPASALFVAWTLLNLLLNVRYPALEPPGLYFLPSLDATVLFAGTALLVWRGYRWPRAAVVVLAVLVVVVRAFRIADGIVWRYFNRPIDLGLDMPTAGEMVRLLRTTVAWPILLGSLVLLTGLAVAFGALTAYSLRAAERAFASQAQRALFAGTVVFFLMLSPLLPADSGRGVRQGAFSPSVVPRLSREVGNLLRLDHYKQAEAARARAEADRLKSLPHDLHRLGGANLLLFFVESYGATVLEQPQQLRGIVPVYQAIDAQLAAGGFQVASSLLDSPTYGGRSQLAHQAMATGVRADNRINDAVVQEIRPKTMARYFRDAGYRTVLVMPGNTHRGLYRWVYDFDKVYASWDLDYHGPPFGFASMPDQYVVDFIHRKEVVGARAPLLIEYALVTSHAPWNLQPAFIEDWSRLGNGSLFLTHPAVHFDINWSNLHQASEAYLRSIAYDLRVVADYLGRFDPGNALVVVLGDHQPIADVTRSSPSLAVPVHVISRQAALIDAFRARGYSRSMNPARPTPPPGMETFLPQLLRDLSR